MLKKLLKYDFRANFKIFRFLWPLILLFGVVERLLLLLPLRYGDQFTSDHQVYASLIISSVLVFLLAMAAAYIFALVYAFLRFRNGLLGAEGYLMFTLPVKPWQLIASKLITAFFTAAVTLGLIACSGALMLDGLYGTLGQDISDMLEQFDLPMLELLLEALLNVTFGVLVTLSEVYLACSVGQLVNRHRTLCSVLSFVVLQLAQQCFTSTVIVRYLFMGIYPVLWYTAGIQLVFSAVCLVFSEYLLRRHLNLE